MPTLALLGVASTGGTPPGLLEELGPHACCGDCYLEYQDSGTLNIACSVDPDTSQGCDAMDCSGVSGNCTYNESFGNMRDGTPENKVCGSYCTNEGGNSRLYDYASDNCA